MFRVNMELLIGQHMEKGESSSSSAATVVAGASLSVADHKKDNGSSILTKDQRIEKVSLIHPTRQAESCLAFLLNNQDVSLLLFSQNRFSKGSIHESRR